jgi:hypothetical protein
MYFFAFDVRSEKKLEEKNCTAHQTKERRATNKERLSLQRVTATKIIYLICQSEPALAKISKYQRIEGEREREREKKVEREKVERERIIQLQA